MLINTPFVLASSSSSRYKLLKQMNLKFKKAKPECNENLIKKKLLNKKTTPTNIAKELSAQKALSVSIKKHNQFVVGGDTIIVFREKIINKAKNIREAREKLKKLSGKEHKIISAAVVFFNGKKIWSGHQTTSVKLRALSENQINKYLNAAGKKILSAVGCYHLEALGPQIIEDIRGDFFNVMGFPLFPFLKFIIKKS